MFVLKSRNTLTVEVRKSRFIAVASPVTSKEEARQVIEEVSDKEATHNCWAYRIGDIYRFSDDGEPGGTAGRPILAAIERQELDNCLVVVTRFFGGIKLGTGGLVRAYGGAAAKCLNEADIEEKRIKVSVSIFSPFDSIGDIYPLLKQFDAQKTEEHFQTDGVEITVEIDAQVKKAFEKELADATRGRARVVQKV